MNHSSFSLSALSSSLPLTFATTALAVVTTITATSIPTPTMAQQTHTNTSTMIETKEFDAKNIRKVEVDNRSGAIKIVGTNNEKASVSVEKVRFTDKCKIEIEQSGDKLTADVSKTGLLGRTEEECQVNLTLNVPKNIRLKIRSGAGNLNVHELRGRLDYKLDSGDVEVDGQIEKLDGKSDNGSTTVKGLMGSADLKTGSGDVIIGYTTIPHEGELEVKAGNGNVTLSLPQQSKLRTSLKTSKGVVTNDFGDDKNSKFKAYIRTGAGDIKVRAL